MGQEDGEKEEKPDESKPDKPKPDEVQTREVGEIEVETQTRREPTRARLLFSVLSLR